MMMKRFTEMKEEANLLNKGSFAEVWFHLMTF